jgi:probable F420-dependent oxidoreductase
VRYGITMFATDVSIDIVELAREAEARGFDSLWLPEHTHIPTSRKTPPAAGQEVLPDEYKRCLDPLVALGAAASATTTLRLGTGILLAAQREPIVTAKAVATLDHLSGGRAALGVGFGWNEDEIEHHGVTMTNRRDVARETILAMQALWADDEASFAGEHVRFSSSWSWPKPVQRGADGRPRVPVLHGGAPGPKLFAHIAEYGDGWIPIGGAGLTEAIPRFRAAVEEAGRDPLAMEIVPFGSIPTGGKLDHFEGIGVTECVFRLPSAPRDAVLPLLDEQAALIATRG